MKKIIYAVHPDWVTSQHDGDEHFINFTQLCQLYGICPDEAFVWSDQSLLDPYNYVHLYPDYYGMYRIPLKGR